MKREETTCPPARVRVQDAGARSFLFIVNPAAGRGNPRERADQVCRRLQQSSRRTEIKTSTAPGEAFRLAKGGVAEGFEVVVGVGGDGTLQEIARALDSTGVAMGIVPAGTCNDFARAFGISRSDSPERLAQVLAAGRPRMADIGMIGQHRFLTVATFGLASAVNRFVEARKSGSRGTLAYLLGLVWMLPRYDPQRVTLRGDFGERSGAFLLAATGNTRSFGGNLPITPDADCTDGKFQVCLVHKVSALTVLMALGRLLRGTHLSHPAVEALTTRYLEIAEPAEPGWICADGESVCRTPCRLEVRPGALRVIVPH